MLPGAAVAEFWAYAAGLVWGPVTILLLIGTGIYLSFCLVEKYQATRF